MKTLENATKYLGLTDEVTICGCCGKSELKATVALETSDLGVVYFGTTCAAKSLGLKRTTPIKDIAAKISERATLRLKREVAEKNARTQANNAGCCVYVCKRDGEFFSVREAAFNADSRRYGSMVACFTPEAQ